MSTRKQTLPITTDTDTNPNPDAPPSAAQTKRERKAAQARLNSKLSTGPKTPEGKNTSRLNAVKHGQTGVLVYAIEDAIKLNHLSHQFRQDYCPQGQLEEVALERLVQKENRLRSLSVEIATTERYLANQTTGVPKRTPIHAKLALHRDDDPERFHSLDLLYRYQREAERDFLRTTDTLTRLQRARNIEAREKLADQRRIKRELDGWHFRNTAREQLKDLGIENQAPGQLAQWLKERKLWDEQQKKREEEVAAFERELAEREIERKKDDEERRLEKEKKQKEAAEALKQALNNPEPRPENHRNEVTEPEQNQELTPDTSPQN